MHCVVLPSMSVNIPGTIVHCTVVLPSMSVDVLGTFLFCAVKEIAKNTKRYLKNTAHNQYLTY